MGLCPMQNHPKFYSPERPVHKNADRKCLSDSFDHSLQQTETTSPFRYDDAFMGYNNSQQFHSFDGGKSSLEGYRMGFDGEVGGSDDPILPPPAEMEAEEGVALREWRRENALRLEEKEKKEKEQLIQIIEEADDYKIEFHRKREVTCENKKVTNREKEKLFVANHEKFHAKADKNYWNTIAELIPDEVPAVDKRGKKDQEKPAITVVQGPKPGKQTELSRMRQILIKLKHNTPAHLNHSPTTPAQGPAKDAKASDAAIASTSGATLVTTLEHVVVAC